MRAFNERQTNVQFLGGLALRYPAFGLLGVPRNLLKNGQSVTFLVKFFVSFFDIYLAFVILLPWLR